MGPAGAGGGAGGIVTMTTASLRKRARGLRRGELNGPPRSLPRRSNGRPREPAGRSAQVVAVRGSCRTCGLRGGGAVPGTGGIHGSHGVRGPAGGGDAV